MKAAIFSLGLFCLFASSACGQRGGNLFSIDEPAKGPKAKQKSVVTDGKAIENWWREKHGDGGAKIRIIEMTPRTKAAAFEIKHNSGHPLGPYWMSCAEYLDKFRDPEANPDSILYPLRNGSTGAVAFTAKLQSEDSNPWLEMFVVADGEVIYSTREFKRVP